MAVISKLFEGNRKEVAQKAAAVLREGGTVVFPTESSYGLGADARHPAAIRKVGAIKQQPPTKQISIIVADLQQAAAFGKITDDAKKLAEKFMPGPLTLVVEKQPSVPLELSERTIAFRISSHPFAWELCATLGSAITATSANMYDKPSIYSGREVIKQFGNKATMIVDAGELPHNPPSTIYDLTTGKVLRRGPVDEILIRKVLEAKPAMSP
ncbi:MAG: L-threonylcarbamoyladenylate synthase [Candidatus Diapherotrites archaeon]|nr:L-threonylcarbamoyladenylate synthase [Candidatus Diapherotrites archaeon]